jgi:hypothetical protein
MQLFTQKYSVIYFLQPLPDGAEFSSADWPPHITLAETFAIRQNEATMINGLHGVAVKHHPVPTTAMDDAYFGPNHNVQVVLLTMTPELVALHSDVVATLENDCGAVFNNPTYVKQGYRPHSAIRPGTRLSNGDHVTIDSLSIVDMFPDGDPYNRKILTTLPLK